MAAHPLSVTSGLCSGVFSTIRGKGATLSFPFTAGRVFVLGFAELVKIEVFDHLNLASRQWIFRGLIITMFVDIDVRYTRNR